MALTNNDILKKIRVALKLRDDQIVEILGLAGFPITKSELGIFFRKEGHPKYVEMKDQILRNFLNGLIIYQRGPKPTSDNPEAKKSTTKKPETRRPEVKEAIVEKAEVKEATQAPEKSEKTRKISFKGGKS